MVNHSGQLKAQTLAKGCRRLHINIVTIKCGLDYFSLVGSI